MRRKPFVLAVLAAAASFSFTAGAPAQELKIGLSAEPSAMDPHFQIGRAHV